MATQSTYNYFDIIKSITCRIETPKAIGTGIILNTSDNNYIYLVTAKHCLLGKSFDGDLKNEDITILIPSIESNAVAEIKLDRDSRILFSANKTLDIAVIVMSKCERGFAKIPLLDVRYFRQECFFRGYPKAHNSQIGINIVVNFVDNNVVSTQTPLETYDSVSHDNCDGFSGSGVFTVIDDGPFFIGLLYELKEPFRRFNIYNLSQINSVLTEHDLPQLQATTLPFDVSLQQDMRQLERKSHLVLETIKDKFDERLNLSRESIQSRFKEVFQANHLIILKGAAGAGKSAFAKNQVSRLEKDGYKVLAFKADWFAKESIEEVFPTINHNLQDLLSSFGVTQQLLILIDSLEKLLEVDTYFALKEFLQICKQLPYTRLIITCRDYAYQQLIFDMHYDFPSYSFVDIPLLSDEELKKVSEHFSALKNMLDSVQFSKILARPFYLNLAIRKLDIFQQDTTMSERRFRQLIWSHVVAKHSPTREKTFERIAIERATQMSLFVRLEGLDTTSIQELIHDEILEIDDRIGDAYRPSHDIYEDVALIRFIERAFQNKLTTEDFFAQIGGKAPAKRRGFRLWLNDALTEPQRITGFIHDIFESQSIPRFWVDEVITAILRSEYCQTFFEHSKQLLLENEQALLLRFIHLLRTTCQEPDEQLIQSVQAQNEESLYQWIYLKPSGKGWEVLILFIDKHFDYLLPYKPLILRLLTKDWSKKVRHDLSLPVESKAAGMMLLRILNDAKKHYKSRKNEPYSSKEINKGIEVLFQLAREFETEIRKIIEDANSWKKRSVEQYRRRKCRLTLPPDVIDEDEENEDKDYHLRDFYNVIIDFVLSGLGNQAICLVIPDLICKVAKDQWLIDEVKFESDYYSSVDHGVEFGLSRSESDHFPSGIYKTPIRFLLFSHPTYALKLIGEVFNYCTNAYANSNRGRKSNVIDVEVMHDDGSRIVQKGNATLWGIFRGTVERTSYLLESVLMSLESWLLELCQSDKDWADKWLKISYTYLLKNSNSVALTAVLASVAQAYPHRVKSLCFPLLRVREFFEWDIRRLIGESTALSPIDVKISFAQEERYKSNQLPHRKHHLEFLVTKLQLEGYFAEISKIIDKHAEKCNKDDKEWKLALNRMDIRKFVIDETAEPREENQIVFRAVIDKELQAFVEKHTKDTELYNRALSATSWAISLYEGKVGTDIPVERWYNAFNTYQELAETNDDSVSLVRDPTPFAATGIRYFKDKITSEQLQWCVETLIETIMKSIMRHIHRAPYSTLHIKSAIETIPLVLSLDVDDEMKLTVKRVIFLALLNLATNKLGSPIEAFRNSIWKIDPVYAHACMAGMLQHARFIKERRWFPSGGKDAQQEHEAFFHQEEALTEQVVTNKITIDLTGLSFDTHSSYYLGIAIQLIPFSMEDADHQYLLRQLFQLHIEWNKKKRQRQYREDLSYGAQLELKRYIAKFVLLQNKHVARIFFAEVLDSIFVQPDNVTYESVEYVADIFEWIITEQDSLHTESFWSIWEVLEDRIRKSDRKRYVSYLLLSHKWWNSKANSWKPLQSKALVMRRLVTEFGRYDLKAVMQLLSGIGMEALMPHGLNWLRNVLEEVENPKQDLADSDVFSYSEKLIQRTYYKYLREIKQDRQLQESLLILLDLLVDIGSSLAFIVRERLITI